MTSIRMFRSLGVVFVLGACAGPAVLTRAEVAPPQPAARELPPNPPAQTDEAQTQRWLQQEIDRQRPATAAATPTAETAQGTNEEATRAWLDRTIDERRTAQPDEPPAPIVQTVEHTVYVDRPVYYDEWGGRYSYGYAGYGYDACGEPVYSRHWQPYQRRTSFPVNTALGAGIGAIIGHQSHHRDRGAAIGAGIGLLLDLAR